MKRSNSDDFLMIAIIMAEAHGNCCSDNALYKNGLLLLLISLPIFTYFLIRPCLLKRASVIAHHTKCTPSAHLNIFRSNIFDQIQ